MARAFLKRISKFKIIGLNNYRDFEIDFKKPYKILVGENGLGKTSIMNVFYYVLSREWTILDKVQFDFIEMQIEDISVNFSQSELRMFVGSQLGVDGFFDEDALIKFRDFDLLLGELIGDRIIYFPIFRHLDISLVPLFGTTLHEFLKRRSSIDNSTKDFVLDNLIYGMSDVKSQLGNFSDKVVLQEFKLLCNKYLVETKFDLSNDIILNKNNDDEVSIDNLSSGEKQIINFFARVYLTAKENLIILIDEPEMSLSIKWQKTILPDLLKSGKCGLLFVITHSPFIFKNDLEVHAVPMTIYTQDHGN